MAIRIGSRSVAAALLVLTAAGCASTAPSPTPPLAYSADLVTALTPAELRDADLVATTVPSDAPPAAISADMAVATSDGHVAGGSARGRILAVARAVYQQGGSGPTRTVWAVVYGPGGAIANLGPLGGSSPIDLQVNVIDDQTGAFVSGYVASGP